MTSFSIKKIHSCNRGFTLLEMLVVVLLVSLLASLLMQGFIYMAGAYSAVERRQARALQQELFEGWLRDSIHGVVNGVDGPHGKGVFFSGDDSTFSGVSLYSLSGESQGVPLRIEWSIKREDGRVLLLYGEAPLTGGSAVWYTIKEWPAGVTASWSYLQNGEWLQSFPLKTSVFRRDNDHVLPSAISLIVDTAPLPVELVVSVRTNLSHYIPPVIEGVF